MNCQECEQSIQDFLQDFLNEPKDHAPAAPMLRHLESCASCSMLLRDLQRTDELVGQTAEVEPPLNLWSRIQSQLSNETALAVAQPSNVLAGWLAARRWRWVGVLAATLLLATAISIGIFERQAQRQRLAEIERLEQELVPVADRNPFSELVAQNIKANPFRLEEADRERNPFIRP